MSFCLHLKSEWSVSLSTVLVVQGQVGGERQGVGGQASATGPRCPFPGALLEPLADAPPLLPGSSVRNDCTGWTRAPRLGWSCHQGWGNGFREREVGEALILLIKLLKRETSKTTVHRAACVSNRPRRSL